MYGLSYSNIYFFKQKTKFLFIQSWSPFVWFEIYDDCNTNSADQLDFGNDIDSNVS